MYPPLGSGAAEQITHCPKHFRKAPGVGNRTKFHLSEDNRRVLTRMAKDLERNGDFSSFRLPLSASGPQESFTRYVHPVMSKPVIAELAFLALGLLFAYPVFWDIFWWGWNRGTVVETLAFCTFIGFGLTFRFWLARFRWIVRSALWLTLLLLTPQVLFPPLWESHSPRFLCLFSALACCLFLLILSRRVQQGQ